MDPAALRLIRFGVFEVDCRSGELRKHGRRVRLQDKPFSVLQALLERPGDVVSRDELRARLWPADTFVDFDNGLNNAVNKVRSALGDSASVPKYIETVGRRGYRFVGALEQVARALPLSASGLAPAPRAPQIASLAVLPLANVSRDSDEEYFSDGMTDALISQLAAIRSLRVISRQSIIRYKGSRAPMPKIGRELQVDALVEGTVVRAGGRLRITAQLIHGATDRHLWSGTWERDAEDVLVVQSEIARAVADAVQATVTAEEASQLHRARPIDPGAYDAYLKGRFFWSLRTRDSLLRSVEYYRAAIAREPEFARAHAAMAESYGPLGYLAILPPDEATPAMRAAATRALEIEPDLVEGLTAIAACEAFHEWRWRDGERDFRRAIGVNPNYVTAYLWYGLLLEIAGRQEENVAARQRAIELDPFSLRAGSVLGFALFLAGRIDEGIARLRGTLELDPGYYFARRELAVIDVTLENYEAAIPAFEAIGERGGLGHALAMAGRSDEARATLARLEADARREYVSPVQLALVQVGLGDANAALSSLERGIELRTIDLAAVRVDPRFAPLRQEPRFIAVLRRMNLDG